MERKAFTVSSIAGTTLTVIVLGIMIPLMTNPHTPTGHEGYVYEQPRIFGEGGFRGAITGPTNFGASLWRNRVINIDTRPSTYTENFKILAKDDLNVSFNFHAVIGLEPGHIQEIVEKYGGEHWYPRFVKESFRTFIREAAQQFDSTDLKRRRQNMAAEVKTHMRAYLEGTPFRLVSLVVGNIDYPEIVAKAVEKKLAAQQLLAEKSTQKEIAQRDAEIRIEEAKGIAQAQKIINVTLTKNYLQHEAIGAQLKMAESPNHTTVYIPVGTNGIPLVMNQK